MATMLQMMGAGGMGGQAPTRLPKNYAETTFAELTRQQWDDYLREYVPLENLMIDYATNPDTVTNAVAEARQDVAQSFQTQQGVNERRMRGLGVALGADEQRAVERSTNLAKSLADVSAVNLTTERVRDRQQSLMGNPAPNLRSA
jgi:hypothetical protein